MTGIVQSKAASSVHQSCRLRERTPWLQQRVIFQGAGGLPGRADEPLGDCLGTLEAEVVGLRLRRTAAAIDARTPHSMRSFLDC